MKLRTLKFLTCLSATVALCLQSTSAYAIYADIKGIGMAGAVISHPIDTLSGAYNPAGLALVGDRLDIEAGWVRSSGSIDISDNLVPVQGLLVPFLNGHYDGIVQRDVFPANFGFNKAFCWCDWQFSAGILVYNRSYQKTTYNKPIFLFGSSKPGLEYLNETVAPTFTATWNGTQTIGVSINYEVERLKVNGIQNFDNAALSEYPGHVTNRGYGYSTGWGVTIGYLGQFFEKLNIGLTYQPKTHMSELSKYKGFVAGGHLDVPAKISGGISYLVLPCLVAAFDVEFLQWSKVKGLGNKLFNDGFVEKLGSKNGPAFGFVDQYFYRFGVEWAVNETWTLRTGFRYADTPIRPSQVLVNALSLDCVERVFTLGGTYNLNACNEISFSGAYGFEHAVRGPIPAALPGHITTVQIGGGNIKLKEQKFAIGLAWGYKY